MLSPYREPAAMPVELEPRRRWTHAEWWHLGSAALFAVAAAVLMATGHPWAALYYVTTIPVNVFAFLRARRDAIREWNEERK